MSEYNKIGITLALLTIIGVIVISTNFSPVVAAIAVRGTVLWVIFMAYLEWRRQK